MKVEGPKGPDKTQGTKKSGGVSSADALMFRGLMAAEDTPETAQTAQTQNIARLDVLLAVQGTDDPATRASKGRMLARSSALIDTLDDIRTGMLTGTLTVGHLIDVADVVASHREKIHDPELTGLMDEIDLRAQVEIAKMRIALDNLDVNA